MQEVFSQEPVVIAGTLRDQLAMAALQGLLACPGVEANGDPFNYFARSAYRYADAMLAIRKRKR